MAITVTFSQGLRINLLDTKSGKNCKIYFFSKWENQISPKNKLFPEMDLSFLDFSQHLKCHRFLQPEYAKKIILNELFKGKVSL